MMQRSTRLRWGWSLILSNHGECVCIICLSTAPPRSCTSSAPPARLHLLCRLTLSYVTCAAAGDLLVARLAPVCLSRKLF